MANGWTDERRAKQAEMIHRWKPWQHSTGAKTPEGKAASSRNAHRFTMRKQVLLCGWVLKQTKLLCKGYPIAGIEEYKRRFKHCYLRETDIQE